MGLSRQEAGELVERIDALTNHRSGRPWPVDDDDETEQE
jgi:hypothetical protein